MNQFNLDVFRQSGLTPREYVRFMGESWETKGLSPRAKVLFLTMLALALTGVFIGCAPPPDGHQPAPLSPDDGAGEDGNKYLTPQPPGREPTPDLNNVSNEEIALLPLIGPNFNDMHANFESSPVFAYDKDLKVINYPDGSHYPGTMVSAFSLQGKDGKALEDIGIVMTSFDADDMHLATRQGNSWVINTDKLESPVTQMMKPEADNVLEFDGIPGQFVGFGSFEGEKGVADIRLLFGVDDKRQLTGEVLYCDANQNCWPVQLGDNAPDGKGDGLASLILNLDERIMTMGQIFESMELDPGDYQPTYHPEGDLGADLGNGVFLTMEGNALLYVGDASFDEVDPKDVIMKDGKVEGVKGYELSGDDDSHWVETAETVVISGVTMTLGEPDENGVRLVTETSVEGDFTPEQIAEKLAQFDATRVGFAPDATVMIMDGQYPKIVSAVDHSIVIAEWNFGKNDLVWDWSKMIDPVTGDNVIFNIAVAEGMSGVNPTDRVTAEANGQEVHDFAYMQPTEGNSPTLSQIYIYNFDRNKAVVGSLKTSKKVTAEELSEGIVSGRIYFKASSGEVIEVRVKNLKCDKRYWK